MLWTPLSPGWFVLDRRGVSLIHNDGRMFAFWQSLTCLQLGYHRHWSIRTRLVSVENLNVCVKRIDPDAFHTSSTTSTPIPRTRMVNILRSHHTSRTMSSGHRNPHSRPISAQFHVAWIRVRYIFSSIYSASFILSVWMLLCNPFSIVGPIEDRFDALKDYFMDWRESLFATVELSTAAFNKWTVDFPALLIFRVIAGAFSLFILVGIWSGLT